MIVLICNYVLIFYIIKIHTVKNKPVFADINIAYLHNILETVFLDIRRS